MTQQVNIHDPTVTVELVVDHIRHGEEVVFVDQGHPIARVVPIPAPIVQRVPGLNRGAMTVDDAFDAPVPDAFWLGDAHAWTATHPAFQGGLDDDG